MGVYKMKYEKPEIKMFEFTIDDIITTSIPTTTTTTAASTTTSVVYDGPVDWGQL